MKLLELPVKDIGDIARGLRALADAVERGDHGEAHLFAWVCDGGAGRIDVGMLGQSPGAGADAHFLFALAQRKLEDVRQQ